MHASNRRSETPRTRTQKRALKNRETLLNAAIKVFAQYGIDTATIQDITEKADLGKGTFYNHFGNKDELVLALIDRAVGVLVGYIGQALPKPASLNEVLQGLLTAHELFYTERRDEFVLLFQGRLLLQLQREEPAGPDQPFGKYLSEIELQIAPFVPGVLHDKIRKLACALAGFISGFLSFAAIGLSEERIQSGLGALATSFVEGAADFLQEDRQVLQTVS